MGDTPHTPPPLTPAQLSSGKIGIVSGSGLNLESVLEKVTGTVAFQDVPGMAPSTVQGHASRFIFGTCGNHEVIIQAGRLHPYEGIAFKEVIRPVEAMHAFGARTIIYTNAVGALAPELHPGTLVGATQVHAWRCGRFPLPEVAHPDFCVPGCDAYGKYWWMHGPCYETHAEVRALQNLGALTVGMSVAPELEACKTLGIKTAVVSCVTNNCLTDEHTSHNQVLQAAQASGTRLAKLLHTLLQPGTV